MEWRIIVLNIAYAIVGVLLMFGSYRMIDKLTPEVDFPKELQKGVLLAVSLATLGGVSDASAQTRSEETLGYVTKIERNLGRMDSRGRVPR